VRATGLRERGIYSLPDGRQFVVCAAGDGAGHLLYSPGAWRRYGPAQYRARLDGRIMSRGLVTRWRLEDLEDTGGTAELLRSPRAGYEPGVMNPGHAR
jgi:hypothetical protein